jgi:hypothetical protein
MYKGRESDCSFVDIDEKTKKMNNMNPTKGKAEGELRCSRWVSSFSFL